MGTALKPIAGPAGAAWAAPCAAAGRGAPAPMKLATAAPEARSSDVVEMRVGGGVGGRLVARLKLGQAAQIVRHGFLLVGSAVRADA
jgi:hypothetical protein